MSTEDDKDDKDDNTTVEQFPETKDPKNNKKIIIGGIVAFVLIIIVTVVLVQQKQKGTANITHTPSFQPQEPQEPQAYQAVLGKHFKVGNQTISNVNANTPKPKQVVKQVATKVKEDTAAKTKVLSELLNQNKITQGKVEENQSSIKQLNDNIGSSQKKQEQAIVAKINQQQQRWGMGLLQKITSLFKAKKKRAETPEMISAIFELVGINLWDSRPQATIRYDGKTSIVDVGSVRLNWKVMRINFDKEQIIIVKNGQEVTLEKVK